MKRLLLFTFMAFVSIASMAQNLYDGYVITLQGDTLHGKLDYRTNLRMAKKCLFLQDGATEPTQYSPGDIAGFRFEDGTFFVTRSFKYEGSVQNYFAEYILKGNVNLYSVSMSDAVVYFFEKGNGETAYCSADLSSLTTDPTTRNKKHEEVLEVRRLLQDSPAALAKVKEGQMTASRIKNVAKAYNNEMCPNGNSSETFTNKVSTMRQKMHFVFQYNFMHRCLKYPDVKLSEGKDICLSLGIEKELPRVMKNLSLEVMADIYIIQSYDYSENLETGAFTLLDLNGLYRLPVGPISVLGRAGLSLPLPVTIGHGCAFPSYPESDSPFGFFIYPYAAIGIGVPISKTELSFNVKCHMFAIKWIDLSVGIRL